MSDELARFHERGPGYFGSEVFHVSRWCFRRLHSAPPGFSKRGARSTIILFSAKTKTMDQYTTNELKVIIENCEAWINEAEGKIREYKRWGASWANSSFLFEAEASLARWQKKKKAAQAELVRRSQYDDLI